MGNNYAAKSHTHTASQITDFTAQVDSRINSKVGDAAIIAYSNQSKSYNAGTVQASQNESGFSASISASVTLDSIAVNNIACIKLTCPVSVKMVAQSISGTSVKTTIKINIKLPSGGTYFNGSNFFSGGSIISTKTETESITGKIQGAETTKTYTYNFEIIRVA